MGLLTISPCGGLFRLCIPRRPDAISYQNEVLEKEFCLWPEQLGSDTLLLKCDVSDSASVEACFKELGEKWGKIDFVVHAIAFSDKNELKGRTIDTTLANFTTTMHISCYSFLETCRCASPIMNEGGSVLTLTYLGGERVLPNYNIMGVAKAALEASVRYAAADMGMQGVRVNAISAGPIKTLAASGIGDFRKILHWNELMLRCAAMLLRKKSVWLPLVCFLPAVPALPVKFCMLTADTIFREC